jgi:hypothetical protein
MVEWSHITWPLIVLKVQETIRNFSVSKIKIHPNLTQVFQKRNNPLRKSIKI